MLNSLFQKRDFYAGALLIVFGCIAIVEARQNPFGSLMHMGPGFFPTALGVLLVLLGVLIAGMGIVSGKPERILPENPQWWGWTCIIAGPIMFIIFGEYGGMAPGTFACVFVSALGDRSVTFKSSTVLALVVAAFGVNLFSLLLHVPMPMVRSLEIGIVSIFYAVAVSCYFVVQPLMRSLPAALATAVVVGALYVLSLFYIPVPASFVLAGALGYLALRQAPPEALTSPVVEALPPVFAAANLSYWLFRQGYGLDGLPSLALAAAVAVLLGLGLFFPSAARSKSFGDAPPGLFERGGALLPLLPAIAFLAASFGYLVLLANSIAVEDFFIPRWVIIGGYLIVGLVLFGLVLFSSLHYVSAGAQPSGAPGAQLRRFDVNPLFFALACVIVIFSVAHLPLGLRTDLSAILAGAFAVGVIFAPGTRTTLTEGETAEAKTLFPAGEVVMPYLLSLVLATAAAEYVVFFSADLTRGIR